MSKVRWPLVLAVAILAVSCASQPVPNRIAFVHANVVPMNEERVLRDQTVVTENGRIVQIGPAAKVKVPRGASRVDATDRYLLPALCDMHVHLEAEAFNMMMKPEERLAAKDIPFDDFLFPFVANGVTTVQVLSATHEHVPLRQQIDKGERIGPRLVLAPMIDGPKKAWPPPISTWVATPEEARAAVRNAKAEGYDKIKVYSFLSKESYDAIVTTAKELHMDVIGHVPMALSVEYVIDSGQKMIAHSEEIAKHTHGDYSPERIDYFADLMAKRGVWMMPTLVTTRAILDLFDNPDAVLHRPEAVYHHHPMQNAIWTFITENLYKPIPAEARTKIRNDFEKFQRPLTKSFHDKGGKMMTGTDALLPGLVAGFALHRELHELVDVGLTPYEALRTSTTLPFEYLGESEKMGTIEVGKQGDLLLVDGNPLENIAAASKISGVLLRGRWMAKEEIDTRMKQIATR